jgi:hypothetical protein
MDRRVVGAAGSMCSRSEHKVGLHVGLLRARALSAWVHLVHETRNRAATRMVAWGSNRV